MLNLNYLQKGDRVAVVSPAGQIAGGSLIPMLRCMERWGLQPVLGSHVYARDHTFAGTDEQRIADLQQAINDPGIKAVVCARGGYGSSRIVDRIDVAPLLKHPKLLVGFSDITALHARWHRLGLPSIHAVMSSRFPADGSDSESTESLRKALFGEPLHYTVPFHPLNRTGACEGVMIGGNLSVIAHLTGSADEWDTRSKILFLEDIHEYLYALDRLMLHLQRAGKLLHLRGLLLGYFTGMKDGEPSFGKTAYEIIAGYVKELNIPVAYNFPAGHEEPNLALPFGRFVRISVKTDHTTLDF